MTTQDLLTTREATELLSISRPTLYRWVDAGRLQRYKIGRGASSFYARQEVELLRAELERVRPAK